MCDTVVILAVVSAYHVWNSSRVWYNKYKKVIRYEVEYAYIEFEMDKPGSTLEQISVVWFPIITTGITYCVVKWIGKLLSSK